MKKTISLTLAALMLALTLTACGTHGGETPGTTPAQTTTSHNTPGKDTTPSDTTPSDTTPSETTPSDTTPSDTTPSDTTPTDPAAGKTAAEVLCEYYTETIRKNPGASLEKLSNIFALHPYLDALTLESEAQDCPKNRKPFLFGFDYGTEFPAFDSVLNTYSMDKAPYASCVFKLKSAADADEFMSFVKNNAAPDLDGSTKTQLSLAHEGDYVVLVICSDIKTDLSAPRPENAVSIMKRLRIAADISMSVMSIDTGSERSNYYLGLSSTVPLVEKTAAVCEPSMGGGFSVVIVKVKNADDVSKVAADMTLDPAKWVCMRAESTKVVSAGQYVLGVMASGADCERIADAFENMIRSQS